jgi:polar amino acid transport system substrate-binding protein
MFRPLATRWAKLPAGFALLIAAALHCVIASAIAQTPDVPKSDARGRGSQADSLRGAWYPWDPYQYRDYRRGVPILTGLDVEIERAVERLMGIELPLSEMAWRDQLKALADGTLDIAAGAFYSDARNAYAYFSKPYRTETDVLILPSGAGGRYPFRTIGDMLDTFRTQKFRLGVIAGYDYADPRVAAFIADPANKDLIVPVAGDAQNLRNLRAGLIDGFLADRIAATTLAWRRNEGAFIEEHPLRFSADMHFMLSRATQTPEMLARLDAAIDKLKASGEIRNLIEDYALPVMIHKTLDSEWFRILTFIGTVAFALSGVVLAYGGRYSLFGALILACLPAVGGGLLTDLLLQRDLLGVVRTQALATVFCTVLAGMVVIRAISRVDAKLLAERLQAHARVVAYLIKMFDAVGLAAFTVIGVVVVLDTSAHPIWFWGPIAAVFYSSFGVLMRDLVRTDRMTPDLRGEFYPEVAAIFGLAFAIFLQWEGGRLQADEIQLAVIVTILGAFLLRMVAIARGWHSWSYV